MKIAAGWMVRATLSVARVVAFWGCASLLPGLASAQAQVEWKPSRQVEWLVPATAGSQLDNIVRMAQHVMQKYGLVDVPIVPLNHGGASQTIATNMLLARSPGDGHTLQVMSATLLSAHILGRHKLDFTAATPLAYLGAEYYVYAVKADSAIKSGTDLIERLRHNPGSLTMGASNLGGVGHIQMLAVLSAAGVDTSKLVVVGFKGGSQARAALMSGDIDMNSTSGSNMAADIRSGRVRAIAVNAPKRLAGVYADVPTWSELGVKAPLLSGWAAVLGPRGLSAAQIAYWDRVFAQLFKSKEWIEDAERQLRSLDYKNSAETRAFLDTEYQTLQGVVGRVGIVAK